MGLVAWFIYKELLVILGAGLIKEVLAVAAASIIGAVLYLIMITLMKVEEVDLVFDIVKKGKDKLIKR